MRSAESPFDREVAAMFEAYFPALYRYLDRASGDPDLAADIAQETFARLHRRGQLPDDVYGWLGTVATNLLRDDRRRNARRRSILAARPMDALPDAIANDDPVERDECRARVRSALDRLSERDRQLLLLRQEGLSYRQLASAIGVAETSVGTLLVRALRAFREAVHASD